MADQQVINELGYNPRLAWSEQRTAAEQQAARTAEVQRIAAWRADQATLDAERRDALNQKIRDAALARANMGIRLVELRERSGLSIAEIAAFANVRVDILSRMERGIPVGYREVDAVMEAYTAAAFLSDGKRGNLAPRAKKTAPAKAPA
jgi:ribosome-binding protein aMBF1 (putative translation factor)